MKENFNTTLYVNRLSIDLNPFIEEFIARTLSGAVSSLKEVADIQRLEFNLEQGDTTIIVNGQELSLTPFPNKIITDTIIGLVSSLKGVAKIDSLNIIIDT